MKKSVVDGVKLSVLCAVLGIILGGCADDGGELVKLLHGYDESAGGDAAFIITTPAATYFLEKEGGGLSSMIDPDGVDWLGFHKASGSGHKGEFRGFPNAVHRQDGNFFHAMNDGTDPSTSEVTIETADHVQITVTSGNGQWEGLYDFYPDRLDFSMMRVSPGYNYWIQYEGVPGGDMNTDDFRISSRDSERRTLDTSYEGDLPAPEWMAFGDNSSPRVLYMLHHGDDDLPDDYAYRPDMTVFAFGRRGKDKFLTAPQTFSIGFIESTDYQEISTILDNVVNSE